MPVSQCGPLADLAARAREVDLLSQRIVPRLPAPLREHVGFAGLRNDRLLLLVESPAWATRARMDQARILAAVHSLGFAAGSVAVKVTPHLAPSGDSCTARPLSSRGAKTIRQAAMAMADPELRALFLELAALAEGSTAK
ncbi:MAG: DciA family protein [Rhodanobacteraceae bacterium]